MMTPDLIVLARTVHTLDAPTQSVEAVAVKDGLVTAVGTRKDAAGWRSPRTEVVDLGAATLTPGLIDGHLHPVMGLGVAIGCDLSNVTSLDQMREALQREAGTKGPGEWVQAWGLNPTIFGPTPLHRESIDDVLNGRPCLIRIFDAHSALVSTRALQLATIDGPRTSPEDTGVVYGGNGLPTGLLLEWDAMSLVADLVPAETFEARLHRLKNLLEGMSRSGLTAAYVMDLNGDSVDLFRALEEDGELPLRLHCAPWCMPGTGESDWSGLVDMMQLRGRRWSVDAVKLFIDGTIDNGTAWLASPDVNGESATPFWPDPAEYTKAVHFFASHGIPTATHAIGDAGTAHVLGTFEALPSSARTVPHRVEHLETVPDELIQRFARAGLVASMQPTHCTHYAKADHSDNWSQRLGDERADRAWRCRDIRDAGITLVLGSDWPVAPFEPLPILADAQLRRRSNRPHELPIGPTQALTARQALEGYTTHAARAGGHLGVVGTITVGKRADFTAFESDPLGTPPELLATSGIVATVVGGAVQFVTA